MNYSYVIIIMKSASPRAIGGFTSYSKAEKFAQDKEINFYVIVPIEDKDRW